MVGFLPPLELISFLASFGLFSVQDAYMDRSPQSVQYVKERVQGDGRSLHEIIADLVSLP